MTFAQQFLDEVQQITARIDAAAVEAMVEVLAAVRERGLSSGCLVGTYQRADGSIQSGEARTGLAGGAAIA